MKKRLSLDEMIDRCFFIFCAAVINKVRKTFLYHF